MVFRMIVLKKTQNILRDISKKKTANEKGMRYLSYAHAA